VRRACRAQYVASSAGYGRRLTGGMLDAWHPHRQRTVAFGRLSEMHFSKRMLGDRSPSWWHLWGCAPPSSGGGAGIRGFTLIVGARDLFHSCAIPFPSRRLSGPRCAGPAWKRTSAGHRRVDGGASFLCCACRGVLCAQRISRHGKRSAGPVYVDLPGLPGLSDFSRPRRSDAFGAPTWSIVHTVVVTRILLKFTVLPLFWQYHRLDNLLLAWRVRN
jgi:hypothetical protein